MRSAPPAVVAVLAWCTVVAVGSTLVWVVISGVGEDIAAPTTVVPDSPTSAAEEAAPHRPPTRPGVTVSRAPSSPTRPATTPGVTPAPTTTSPSTRSAGPSKAPSTPVNPAERRSWEGEAGVVVAECRGQALGLRAVQPNPGYAVEVDEDHGDRLEVEFEGRDEEEESHTKVEARCVNGIPAFAVEVEH